MDAGQTQALGKITNVLGGQAKSLERIADTLSEIEKHLRAMNERQATRP